ncbi:spindle pole body formation-associated domain-containing protein [Trichoderma ceciliae]
MLGWVLGRGDNAPDAVDTGGFRLDTTILDQPDTPAPVFAARAFKSALFGTPIRDAQRASRDRTKAAKSAIITTEQGSETPLKPQGILLTPGTGTSRRKRVSFNHDIATKTISPIGEEAAVGKRARLSDVLDKARRKSSINISKSTETYTTKDETDEDEWEEEEHDGDNGDFCANDITLDLNEPHSESGRYWKEEFEKYHREARAEMEKLLKYKKHLKSYAEEKDLEAIQLAQRLKEEQEKVVAMEKKIAENANQMASKQKGAPSNETTELLATLTKQTALAAQYRHRVQELEAQLEELLQGREEDDESRERRRLQGTTSPNTARTLLDTQRELRRSRAQLKELDALRNQVSSLKAQLKAAEQRKTTDHLAADEDESTDTAKMRQLKAQLRQAKEESSKKDDELRQLKKDFDVFKKEGEAHDADAKAVLGRAHTKISDLKKELKSLKAGDTADAARPRGWNHKSEGDKAARDDEEEEEEILPRLPVATNGTRRSIDVADLERPRHLFEVGNAKLRTLRDKYRTDATPNQSRPTAKSRGASEASGDQPNIGKPRWQPFVPRSPRNRASRSEDASKRKQTGGDASIASGGENIALPGMPALAKPMVQPKRSSSLEDTDVQVDLLQDRFARLGGPDAGQDKLKDVSKTSNSKRSLPPERRAAALARIEKRMAEKRAQRRDGIDKENHQMASQASEDGIQNEIALLESRLNEAKARLSALNSSSASSIPFRPLTSPSSSTHFLFLLSDSALPIGSFAFSSGLESFAAHNPRASSFSTFLPLSLSSFASTTLPFVLAAHRNPASLESLDDQLDAAVICTVGRRASVAQGRALLSIWERSFKATLPSGGDSGALILEDFSTLLRRESNKSGGEAPLVSAHLGPLFGAICLIVGLTLRQTAYVFMLSHVKALISAAVRANVFGPYQAQKLLAGENVQTMINAMVEREWQTPVEEAGQRVPIMDLWVGRHELLYSRIFNS